MKSASEMKRKQNRLRALKRLAEKVSENHQVHVEQNRTGSSIMKTLGRLRISERFISVIKEKKNGYRKQN